LAADVATVIQAAGLIKNGFSFQTGAGGPSLASALFVREMMENTQVTGSFILGGITGCAVDMLNKGIFRKLLDVQGFDLEAVKSIGTNPNHVEISSSFYANPFNSGCAVNQLDCVVLGATEIDVDFNVNVLTGSNGIIMGGAGGHSDAAAGAGLTVIVAKLNRKHFQSVVESVNTVTTPDETVDVLVTDHGIAVNPRRHDLAEQLKGADVPITDIHELQRKSASLADSSIPDITFGRAVAVVEYRDGTIIDTVRKIEY
jgi:citrate lyase subunit alpha/citrate CoA-transferase